MTPAAPRGEVVAWGACAVLMNVAYVYGSFVSGEDLFGIDALRRFGPTVYVSYAAGIIVAAVLLGASSARVRVERPAAAILLAAFSLPVFFLLRTSRLNGDGIMLAPKFEAAIPTVGAYLTHDEMLEFFIHSRFWYYTHNWWGWQVVFSYQVASCLAGAAFVYGLVRLAPRVAPGSPWLFLAGSVAGGYMQLFFGDAENYTLTAVLVVFYVLAASRFLAREVGLWLPTMVLAVAMCFHLEAGWLLPSLLYLFAKSHERHGDLREAKTSTALGATVVAATLVYFHFHGLPLQRFFSSHAGHALRMNGVFAFGMPTHYFAEQFQLLLLLCPSVLILPALAVWRRGERDELTAFLAVSAGSMLVFQATWRAQLGVYDDWNLFAIGGMLTGLLIWRTVAVAARTRPLRIAAIWLAGTGWLHTYAWVLANHSKP